MINIYIYIYPPTPAFAKAGAAPGTTGGVDPVFLEPLPRPTLQAKATTRPQQWLKGTPRPQQWLLLGVQGCRLPGLKPSKTLQNPPNAPNPPKVRIAPQGQGTFNKPQQRATSRTHKATVCKATAMAPRAPLQTAAMASYSSAGVQGCRLQQASTPSKTARTTLHNVRIAIRREKAPSGRCNGFL